jgi:hypothetical protein
MKLTSNTLALALTANAQDKMVPVTIENFLRVETDLYFGQMIKVKGLGKLAGSGELTLGM